MEKYSRKGEKEIKGWNIILKGVRLVEQKFSYEIPPHYSHVFNFAMWDNWVLAIYFFFLLSFSYFFLDTSQTRIFKASKGKDLLHVIWIKFHFLIGFPR